MHFDLCPFFSSNPDQCTRSSFHLPPRQIFIFSPTITTYWAYSLKHHPQQQFVRCPPFCCMWSVFSIKKHNPEDNPSSLHTTPSSNLAPQHTSLWQHMMHQPVCTPAGCTDLMLKRAYWSIPSRSLSQRVLQAFETTAWSFQALPGVDFEGSAGQELKRRLWEQLHGYGAGCS